MTDFNFRVALINYLPFAEVVDDIVIEAGNYLYQDMLDDYILKLKDVPDEELCKIWRNHVISNGVWDATIYKDFIYEVRKVNEKLPPEKRIRLIAAEPPIDWSKIKTGDEMAPFLAARCTHAVDVMKSEVLGKNRKTFIIYGGAHFYRSSNVVDIAGRLRTSLEEVMQRRLFTILPLSGDDEYSRNFQKEFGVDKLPFFLHVKESELSWIPGDQFFGEAWGTLAGFTDGVLFFGIQTDEVAEYDSVAANDTTYQNEKNRRILIRDEAFGSCIPNDSLK
jgi:hypothetical protein